MNRKTTNLERSEDVNEEGMREQQHLVRGGHCSDHLLVKGENKREEVPIPGNVLVWCNRLYSLCLVPL